MKSSKLKTAVMIFALLAFGAAVFATLGASQVVPVTEAAAVIMSPSPLHTEALQPSPFPSPSPSPTPSVTAGPLSGYLIGIDPGHQQTPNPEQELNTPGGTETKDKVSEGAHGSYTGIFEYVINLQVALKLKANLESLGASVIMTRETHDVDISNIQRAQMMNDAGVDCWLRIHANNSDDPEIHGMFMIVPAKGCLDTDDVSAVEDSRRLADTLLTAALSSTGADSRGVRQKSDQTGFNWSKVPVCTIEMGFLTNKAEEKLLTSDGYQQRIADGLAQGFVDYFTNQASVN